VSGEEGGNHIIKTANMAGKILAAHNIIDNIVAQITAANLAAKVLINAAPAEIVFGPLAPIGIVTDTAAKIVGGAPPQTGGNRCLNVGFVINGGTARLSVGTINNDRKRGKQNPPQKCSQSEKRTICMPLSNFFQENNTLKKIHFLTLALAKI
jgi:hypothetical protein